MTYFITACAVVATVAALALATNKGGGWLFLSLTLTAFALAAADIIWSVARALARLA